MRLGHAKNSRIFEEWYLTFGDESYKNAELAALGVVQEIETRVELKKCWQCGMDIPDTEDRCLNCQAAVSGKTLQEDVREKGELEDLKFQFRNMETMLMVLIQALGEDPKLREHIKVLASKGVEPFIELLE